MIIITVTTQLPTRLISRQTTFIDLHPSVGLDRLRGFILSILLNHLPGIRRLWKTFHWLTPDHVRLSLLQSPHVHRLRRLVAADHGTLKVDHRRKRRSVHVGCSALVVSGVHRTEFGYSQTAARRHGGAVCIQRIAVLPPVASENTHRQRQQLRMRYQVQSKLQS